jgi:AAA family ATP:ADP antiporter
MVARLRRLLDVRPGEGRVVLYTFLYIAIAVGSFLLAKAIRNGLFLQVYGASKLAYVYVAVPLVLMILVPVYTAVVARIGHRRVATGALLFLALNVLAFWWGLTFAPKPWLSAAFYIWVNCYGVIAPVQAWSFANSVFDTRQARRLFGLIGSGASAGAIVGGFVARTLVGPLGTVNLLLVLLLMITAAVVVVNVAYSARRPDSPRAGGRPAAAMRAQASFADTLRQIGRTPYLRSIALLVVFVAITTQWTQYQFQAAAEARFAGDADRLTRFFGDFNSVMGGVALLIQVLLTGPALRRFGLGATIMLLPVMLGFGVSMVLLTGLLWAIVMTNAFDQGLRFSVDKASFELLYLPIAPATRERVKSTIDLIINRLADAAGGILLGVATAGFTITDVGIPGWGLGPRGIAAVTLLFVGAWLVVAFSLRHGYVAAIRDSITQHRLEREHTTSRVLDRFATELLAARLNATEPREILYALDLFRMEHRGATHPAVRGLLTSIAPDVRRRAVAVLDEAGDTGAIPQVEALLNDPDPGVRAEALVFLAHHADIDPLQRITSLTEFEDFSVQAGLVAFLGRPSAWQNVEAASVILDQMIADKGPGGTRARTEAARLLAQLPAEFDGQLSALIEDGDEQVARAALAAAGTPDRVGLAETVMRRLGDVTLRPAAAEALADMGTGVVGALRDLLDDGDAAPAVRAEVPRILSTIGGSQARDTLLSHLFEADVPLRTHIIAGLSRLHAKHRDLAVDRQAIEMVLTAEIMGHYRSYQIVGTLGSTFESNDPVAQGLRHAMEQERERIFRLLDPLLPDQDMKSVYLALRSQNRTLRANALELLDNVLSPQLRELVVPLFDGQVTIAERVRRADSLVGAPVRSPEEATLAMLASEDAWLKACGVYAAGALRLVRLRPLLDRQLASSDPLLRETARAAILRLDAPAAGSQVLPGVSEAPESMEPTLSHGGESFGVG